MQLLSKTKDSFIFRPWAVVVSQMAELLLTAPEDPGSNPVIGLKIC